MGTVKIKDTDGNIRQELLCVNVDKIVLEDVDTGKKHRSFMCSVKDCMDYCYAHHGWYCPFGGE
jgi:hypothetical protein